MKTECVLAVPGDPETITGGYEYDRRVVRALAAGGAEARFLRLPGDFPLPANESVDSAFATLAAVPADTVLVIDGLALAALPDSRLRGLRRPIVGLVHHPLALEPGLSPAAAARFAESERLALAACAAIIVTSPTTARVLAADYAVPEARLIVALPGTDPAPQARGSADDGDGVPTILSVGSLIPRKGHDVLVAALARLRDRPWRLTIVGAADRDPAAAAALAASIAAAGLGDRISLLGAVDRRRLAALTDAADLFALLSSYEGYGMAFAEALAAGLPIVACAAGAVPETVPEAAGILVPPGDVDAAAAAFAALLDDPALRRAKADGARAAGLRLPSWADTAATVASVVRRVAITTVADREAAS